MYGRAANAVSSAFDLAQAPKYRSGRVLWFLLEGRLSDAGEGMCTKYYVTVNEV